MPRTTLSTEFLRGAYAQETEICPVFLVTISHEDLSQPILISSDPTQRLSETASSVVYGTVSRGEQYVFFPFTLTLPSDEDDGPQNMSVEWDNVDRVITETLRGIEGPPIIKTEIILADAPDLVEATWPDFLLTQVTYDSSTIKGTLSNETLVREPFPALCFTPSYFPGVFG